jgi:YVTN family beta-propeller protein
VTAGKKKTLDTGSITNHVNIVRNANGMFAYITVGGINEVQVYRTSDFSKVATIPVGMLPHGIWPSGDGARVYVGLENEDRIAAIDTLTNKVIATSSIGQAAQAVVYVPNAIPMTSANDNVRREVKALPVDYAVAVDSEYVIWRAFSNNYWPALYFVDAQGRVRHHYFGEGSHEQSEMVIQRLLTEAGASGIGDELVSVDPRGFEVAADWASLKSPENYVGYDRTEGFASPGGAVRDKARMYELPTLLRWNDWALSGDWTIKGDAVELNKPNGRIAYRFHARS